MNLLSVENLGKNFGERILFSELNFGLQKGDKVALIANNGTGKSSMLKIIAGQDQADEGKVVFRNQCKVAYLPQQSKFDNNLTIQELINSSHNKITILVREYENAIELNVQNNSIKNQEKLEFLTNQMNQENGWDYENNTKQMLSRFNVTQYDQKIGELSGGQKKRLSLALLLLDNADILLLDEPTNHLDVTMIEWLQKYLQKNNITLLMVTHDRYFMEDVCNHILELENGKLYNHKGNYAYFLEKRMEREANFTVETAKAKKLMKKELEWIRRSPKARTTKSKARIANFEKIKVKASRTVMKKEIHFDIKMDRIGGKVLELKHVKKSYGESVVLNGFTYTFRRGERIGILGQNGVGKSTLLNIITGEEEADSGKINTGETVVYGYFNQKGIEVEDDKRVIQVLKDVAEYITLSNGTKISASQLLEQFMFPPDMQYTQVHRLSGGEKRRLYLLTVLMKNANFLILDEPTNDLDILTLTKLEEFLLEYKGCLIIVSHDRFFMDKLTDHLFVFKGNGVIENHDCTYSEYRAKEIVEEKKIKQKKVQQKTNVKGSNKISFKDKYEYESLEKNILILEKEKNIIEQSFNDNEIDDVVKKSQRLSVVIKDIEDKTNRWMQLDEILNS
jgi:ATP-binding cassette subfamily F protein uup